MSERAALQPKRPEEAKGSSIPDQVIYHDSSQTPMMRMAQMMWVGAVIIMVLVCLILSIVQGIKKESGICFALGLSLIGFVAIEIILIFFIRRDHLDGNKSWFLYFVGGVVILESIFTDILLFQ
ncbi:hypothetical protein ACF0H5_000394 [Mactra antiquata]